MAFINSNRSGPKAHKLVLLISALLVTTAAPVVMAHHSTAQYEDDKTVTISGTVSHVLWANPHTYFDMVVTTNGKPVTWTIIYGTPTMNARNGWRKDDVKVGDKVTAIINPTKSGEPGGILRHITLADGRELKGVREFLGVGPNT